MTYISPGRAKLSAEDVSWIRKWYADGTFEKRELAIIYDINVQIVTSIVLNRGRWKK